MVLLLVLPMACIWKHPKSKYWYARFVDGNGRRRNRSTEIVARESTRKRAERLAEQWEEVANRKRTALQCRKVIAELHREITGEDMATLSLRNHIEGWLAAKKPETAPATYAFYKGATDKFLAFMGERADADIAGVTRQDVVNFRNRLAGKLASGTVNHHVKALRMLFKAAERDALLMENPCAHVETVKKEAGRAERRPFTLDELQAVLAVAGPDWRSMILFGLYTGQRLMDLAGLTWQNIDTVKNEVRLVTRKTGRRMTIPMAEPLKEHVATLTASDDPSQPVHPSLHDDAVAGRSGRLSNAFNALLASVGLRPAASRMATKQGRSAAREASVLSFHSLRATAATMMHEAGVPAAMVQELIGHDSEEVHRVYVKIGREALREAAGKLPRVG